MQHLTSESTNLLHAEAVERLRFNFDINFEQKTFRARSHSHRRRLENTKFRTKQQFRLQ